MKNARQERREKTVHPPCSTCGFRCGEPVRTQRFVGPTGIRVGWVYGRVQPSDYEGGCGHSVFWDSVGMSTSAERSGIERDTEAQVRKRKKAEVRESIEAMKKISPPIPPGYRPPRPEREQEEQSRRRILIGDKDALHPKSCKCPRCLREAARRKGPLRKIVRIITRQQDLSRRVLLECGHKSKSWGGQAQARCLRCKEAISAPTLKNSGPLRKIMSSVRPQKGSSVPGLVLLECGHQAEAWGQPLRTRCLLCFAEETTGTAPLKEDMISSLSPKERCRLDALSIEEGRRLDTHAQVPCPCGSEIPFGECHDLVRKILNKVIP